MRRIVLSGIIMAIIIATAMIVSASTTNNGAMSGVDQNKYTLANLSHMTTNDFHAYVEVKHTNPLTDQVKIFKEQGLDNASIEKKFAENGITYNSKSGAFILAGGHKPTPEELKHYITPTYPFKDNNTTSPSVNSLMETTSSDLYQSNVVLETTHDLFQGITMRTSHGTLATTADDEQRVYTMHMELVVIGPRSELLPPS